ncbi:MAG: TrmH family RNA methyltransferase [Vicinamibacterales bacterium]
MIERVEADDVRLRWYAGVRDPVLLREGGRFVAEGRLIVARLLEQPEWVVESVLVSDSALAALRDVVDRRPDVLTFVLPAEALAAIAGFNVHRGCLAIGRRRPLPSLSTLVAGAEQGPIRLLGLEGLVDADNVGACFRNAAALGAHAVVLDARCADPLYRKAIRTSMGASLRVPYTRISDWLEGVAWLSSIRVTTVALTPAPDADASAGVSRQLSAASRLALLVGSEGSGLTPRVQRACDHRVRIEMMPGEDSLNVATAAAIALHGFAGDARRGS